MNRGKKVKIWMVFTCSLGRLLHNFLNTFKIYLLIEIHFLSFFAQNFEFVKNLFTSTSLSSWCRESMSQTLLKLAKDYARNLWCNKQSDQWPALSEDELKMILKSSHFFLFWLFFDLLKILKLRISNFLQPHT